MKRRWNRTSVVLLTVTVGLWFMLLTQWWQCNLFPLLHRVDPKSSAGIAALKVVALKSRPLLEAIENYQHDHGSYPPDLRPLYGKYLPESSADKNGFGWNGWYYSGNDQNYSVYTTLGWDPILKYEHRPDGAKWLYDPGDGSEQTTMPFQVSGQ